ncbi:hypothetical protein [Bacillus sp. FJAT-45037]|uniref:hypothetical protein n=1 Tax=Bacillus sp. FJAT-45037 TaxID=2011007 RepID=UPI000C24BD1C|nr:hypothetical protein [Bacillus sp. FJAT-45037]
MGKYDCCHQFSCDGRSNNNGIYSDITISNVGPNVSSQFSELSVSNRTPIIELKSTYGISAIRDVLVTAGGGTVTNDTVEYLVTSGGGGTGAAILESAERGRYQAGYAAEGGIGVRLPVSATGNQIVRWGLFDSQNGLFFGQSGTTGTFLAIRRAGVDTVVPQASWNIDPLNGSGPSGQTLNLATGNIFKVVFSWYGYGVIEWQVVVQNPVDSSQKVITVHRFKPANQTSLTDPNLPVRGEINNNGTASSITLFIGGRSYSLLGRSNTTFRVTSARRGPVTVGTTPYPLISFQRKAIFPAGSGRSNSVNIRISGSDILTNNDVAFLIYVGSTVNTAFVNFPTALTNIPDNETALLVNTTSTAFGTLGQVVYQSLAQGGLGNSSVLSGVETLDLTLPETSIVTLSAATFTGTASVTSVFRMTEDW